ncbi:MAG TPA: CopD family protein [Acetobacteraceae bacterium]|nr:CopD family protein [Acetobacteraceae bacterium]
MSTLEIVVALLRGAHVAALVSLFGTLVFLTLVAPAAVAEATKDAPRLRRRLLRVARISAVLALVIGIAWLAVESAVIAGAGSVATTLHALPVVALRTQFGQWLLVRGVLLLTVLPLLRPWRAGNAVATVLAAIALTVQPMLGHAGALGGSVGTTLIISEVLHLLAAGAWLGSLLPLFITIGTLPHNAAATACRSFTPIGLSAVLVLGGTATVQVAEFMGGLPGLFGTGYGHVALVKLGLFFVLLALAAINRLALTDRLAGTAPDAARRHMRMSVATEAVLGTLVVLTAGFLASHAPGTHEQPVWPFAWRPSLSAFYEPVLRNEVTVALLTAGAAVIIAIIGVMWRKVRWPALVLAVITLALAIPHLDLLFIEAYPTSYFTSPTEFAATAIVHGAKLFAANCVACHGTEGRGDGPSAKSLPLQPADLTAEHFWAHSDGELFWFISHGFAAPDGSLAMPGFDGVLSSEARWDLIDYLRAHNAGESMRTTGKWPHPLPIPQFDIACADGRTLDLDDLRGRVLRIIAVSDDEASAPVPPAGITTVNLARKQTAKLDPGSCVASEPETWTAFAILSGVPGAALAGEQLLIDQNAWLRAAWRPGEPGDWTNPQALAAKIRDIAANPIAADAAGGHVHHH